MNQRFVQYTTSAAFAISLSHTQISMLLALSDGNKCWCLDHSHFGTYRALERKGLIHWKYDKDGNAQSGPHSTPEGELMSELLKRAGFSYE